MIAPDDLGLFKRRMLVYEAKRWLRFTESGGDNKGQVVEMFQKWVDGKAHGEPWCMSFSQFCAGQVDRLTDEIFRQSLEHKSLLKKTEHCVTCWNQSDPKCHMDYPIKGSLMIWRKGSTSSGHVGIVVDVKDDQTVMTIEGNTGPSEAVTREGDGVYLKERDIKGTYSMRVLGFLNPWP